MYKNLTIAIDNARDEKAIAFALLQETIVQTGRGSKATTFVMRDWLAASATLAQLETQAYASGLWRGVVCETVEGYNR